MLNRLNSKSSKYEALDDHSKTSLSSNNYAVIPAPNYDIARFLYQSKSHMAKFKDLLMYETTVDLLVCNSESDGNLSYKFHFAQKQNWNLDFSFEEYCWCVLLEFLEEYVARKKTFSLTKLTSAKLFHPDLTKKRTNKENSHLLVEWDNCEVMIIGLKSDVNSKLEKIEEIIAKPTSVRSNNEKLTFRPTPKPRKIKTSSSSESASASSLRPEKRRSSTEDMSNEEMQNYIIYQPQSHFAPQLDFVWNEMKFCELFKKALSDICSLSGTSEKLKAKPKHTEKCGLHFSNRVIAKIENFLSQIKIFCLPLDSDVAQFLLDAENESWLADLLDPNYRTVAKLNETSLTIKGFEVNVDAFQKKLEEELTFTTKVVKDRDLCRQIVFCDWYDELTDVLGKNVKLTTSLEDESLTLSGRKCFCDRALKTLQNLKTLCKEPVLSEIKLKALETLLLRPNRKAIEEFFQLNFKEEGLKSDIWFDTEDKKVKLTAVTNQMHEMCSTYLDRLLNEIQIPLSKLTPRSVFKEENWRKAVVLIQSETSAVIQIQQHFISLIGFDEPMLIEAASVILQLLNQKNVTKKIRCGRIKTKFVLKHLVPKFLVATELSDGFEISGLPSDVEEFYESTKRIEKCKWEIEKNVPAIADYFHSSEWLNFVKMLESNVRCIVSHRVTKNDENKTSASTNNSLSDITFFYGSMAIKLCEGDITTDNSDVIVNGVLSESFDLSKSVLSSRVLKVAGEKLQLACNNADNQPNRFIRLTKGYNLPCKHVVHVVTPENADTLTARVKQALEFADQLKVTSVALPTLGAGGIGIKPNKVVTSIIAALKSFAEKKSRNVQIVTIVVFDKTTQLLEMFRNNLPRTDINTLLSKSFKIAETMAKLMAKDRVIVTVYSDKQSQLDKAKEEVSQLFSKILQVKAIQNDVLSQLEPNDLFEVYQLAVKHRVVLTYDKKTDLKILLEGINKNVEKLSEKLQILILELKEAVQLSQQVTWKWSETLNGSKTLPLRVSREIEKGFQNQLKRTSSTVSMFNRTMTIDFSTMTYNYNDKSGKLKRKVLSGSSNQYYQVSPGGSITPHQGNTASKDTPSHWVDMKGKPWKKVFLIPASAEFKKVLNLFKASNPQFESISKIERIQNLFLYKQYLIRKSEVAENMRSKNPVERELFHGTAPEVADKICSDGFDRSFAGRNATMYGKGCYFAVDSSISSSYCIGESDVNVKCMFVAQVLTGDYCVGNTSMRTPPEMDCSGEVRKKYDSTVNDENNPSIFVVFKDSSVYPKYLITFL